MKTVSFQVSARTARLIGRENVSNADGAIIELIKNGHDADATNVAVFFKEDTLYIADNGHGMTEDVISGNWMTIGTDNKEMDPFSPRKRIKSGAKGIGRFALDRLGKSVDMYTLPSGQRQGFKWSVNWKDFEKKNITVEKVNATLTEIGDLDLSSVVESWGAPDVHSGITFPNGGTILCIKGLRDTWTEDLLDSLFQSLESLVPAVEMDPFAIFMFSHAHPEKYGKVQPLMNDDYDYRISAVYDSSAKAVTATIHRNEFDLVRLAEEFGDVFTNPNAQPYMKSFPYTLDIFQEGSYTLAVPINKLLRGYKDPEGILDQIGDFTFNLTYAKNGLPNKKEQQKYPYKTVNYRERKVWLERFGGVRIYRDHFRVRPYGENGDDWLSLGERQAQSPAGAGQNLGGFRVRPNQVAGSIHISRISNIAFQDKSSREGIQENPVFNLFQNLLKAIISMLEEDRNKVFYALSELYTSTHEDEQAMDEALEIVAKAEETSQEQEPNIKPAEASTLLKAVKAYSTQVHEQEEELKVLRSLASAGLITASAAHELKGISNRLVNRSEHIREVLEEHLKSSDFEDVDEELNPFILLNDMRNTDKGIQEWLNYALMPLKRDKRRRQVISLVDYFTQLKSNWNNLLDKRKISLELKNFDNDPAIKMFPIDLDTIFNNLIINSVEAFTRRKEKSDRIIKVECELVNNSYRMTYSDNATGIDESFKDTPNDIFLPHTTTKIDRAGNAIGTGMGMYLVKSVVEDNKGSVRILPIAKGFSIEIDLPSAANE
jgi:signal transduction histidine kinase